MKQFDYVEEYLEVIAGHRDPTTGKTNGAWYYEFNPIVNLARYDVRVLESMTSAVTQGQALTKKQADLACKIILNYRRQLATKGVDVAPVEKPQYRVALRDMDYTKRMYLKDDMIYIRFPFDNDLIGTVREFGKTSQGRCRWNFNERVWEADLTEYNLSWLMTLAQLKNFEISSELQELMTLVSAVESTEYAIELKITDTGLEIENCPESLRSYIDANLGGFGTENLLSLVDASAILGYTVSEEIYSAIQAEYGIRFASLATNRELKINSNTLITNSDFDSVLDYADAMERWPVVIFEPDLSNRMLNKLFDRYGADYDQSRYIHTIRPENTLERIPLLISSAGMVFGGDKQLMLQRAEKIVYTAVEVYNNKKHSGKKVQSIAS